MSELLAFELGSPRGQAGAHRAVEHPQDMNKPTVGLSLCTASLPHTTARRDAQPRVQS